MLTNLLVLAPALVLVAGAIYAHASDPPRESAQASPLGTAFTYQGQLKREGEPVSNDCAMAFRLYDQGTGGSQVGLAITTTVPVSAGLFTVSLDFGSGIFNGEARWLGIQVQCPGDAGFADLGRQALTAAPYALYAVSAPWSGLTNVPAGFADGIDNDTTYTAGTGLNLVGNQFNALTSTVQQRVSGVCAVGSTIRAINADGTVVCQPLVFPERAYSPAGNTTLTPVIGGMDFHTAATIGSDGLGLIFYSRYASLSAAHCNDASCSSTSLYTLRDNGDDGGFPSIATGSDGLGLISFYYWSGNRLEVGHCNNPACSSATFTTLDSNPGAGWHSGITIAGDGKGLISYYDNSSGDLRVAHCNDLTCTSAITTTLDMTVTIGFYTSIATGLDGFGLLSYYDQANGDLRVAHCENYTCTTATLSTLDSTDDVGLYTSVTIGQDGLGLISYYDQSNGSLEVAHCNNLACTTADLISLDGFGSADVGRYTGITIGLDGLPRVIYYDVTNNDLRFALCRGPDCQSGAVTYVLDQNARSCTWSTRPAITIGTDGNPLISYHDCYSDPNGDLKIIHCANPYCAPYFRRR
jgi:hypothetical protein